MIFLKRAINEWEYVGHWAGDEVGQGPADDREALANVSRVSGVLFMEPSEP